MNVLNVSDLERELSRVSASAYSHAVRRWVLTVARNYMLGKLDEKDIAANFRVYNPQEKLELLMPAPEELPAWAQQAPPRWSLRSWG